MGILVNDGGSKPVNLSAYAVDMKKAVSVKTGDMVSWKASGGNASGKVIRVVSNGKVNVPDSSFNITGTENDPAVLIQLYRDGKPTETKVGHKMSTLSKSLSVEKHGSHDQESHGSWAGNGASGAVGSAENAAGDKTNSGGKKTKEQVLASNRNAKKVTEIADRLSALSDKMRTKTSDRWTKDKNLDYADKAKAVSEKFKAAASPDISDARHFELTNQAYNALNKLQDAIFSNAGAGANYRSIKQQAADYLIKVDEDLEYMNKALSEEELVEKHGEHDQSSHGSWSSGPDSGDDPSAMDTMEDKPYKVPKLTPAQRKIYNRVVSPASAAYVERPFGGVEFARTWGRKPGEPSVSGYKPFSGPTNA